MRPTSALRPGRVPDVDRTGDLYAMTFRDVDSELCALICDEPDLLEREFEAIVTAEWPTPPVQSRSVATACEPPDGRAARWDHEPVTRPAHRPHRPGIGGWVRQRSPPLSQHVDG